MKPLVVINFNPLVDTVQFTSEHGTWNVSRALRDCRAGKHDVYLIDVAEAYRANGDCDINRSKVLALATFFGPLEPIIGVMEDGALWLIDGHHRLRMATWRGDDEIACYVIEEAHAAHYRVLYNGERLPPFKLT